MNYTKSINTHNNESVAASSSSVSEWIDVDGYNEVGIVFANDTSTNSLVNVGWSNDGTSTHGREELLTTSSSKFRSASTKTKAKYIRLEPYNGDSASHSMTLWAYLKS